MVFLHALVFLQYFLSESYFYIKDDRRRGNRMNESDNGLGRGNLNLPFKFPRNPDLLVDPHNSMFIIPPFPSRFPPFN